MFDHIIDVLDIRVLASILAIPMLAAWEVGKRMGQKLRIDGHLQPSKFADASMAVLGLLLAFTFGTSIAKHDQRVISVVTGSNAICDFYTCATLLKEPTRSKLQLAIRQYAQIRVDSDMGLPTPILRARWRALTKRLGK